MTVQLFINYLQDQPVGALPPQARPAQAPNRVPELREWQAIEHIYRHGLFEAADHSGLLSPKFPMKTGLTFEQIIAFVGDHPGHDLYLFDHGPQYRYVNFNDFEYAENHNPGFGTKFIECLGQMGESVDIEALGRSRPENSVHSNSWVGNARFWNEVIGPAVDLIDRIRNRHAVWRFLCEPLVVDGMLYPYLPLVLERFVPYWLMTRGGFTVKPYDYDKAFVLARCARSLERQYVEAFHDLFNQWDVEDGWTPDRREFIRDISLAAHRYRRSANHHMIYPWTGERIAPVR